MSKKTIGIVGWSMGPNSFGISKPYYEFLREFGHVIILGPDDEPKLDLDLLILPGGKDVSPARYGAVPSTYTGDQEPFLEHFDTALLPQYIDVGVPILGICRGLQTLNVHFGGTLNQHLKTNHPYSDPREEPVHKVYTPSELYRGKKRKAFMDVNSLHHQAIDQLGEGLETLLQAPDGTIEAIRHNFLPIFAVQWHPEELRDDFSISIISSLLQSEEEEEVVGNGNTNELTTQENV